jgi:FixJ family two-component response regulator
VSTKLSISVVDDDESFRLALVELLTSMGYGARGFGSAEDFIAKGGEESCDCVITDIQMPGRSGFELKRLLASRGSTVPVIMITGRDDPGLEAEASATGAIRLLRKPFEADILIDCLEKL